MIKRMLNLHHYLRLCKVISVEFKIKPTKIMPILSQEQKINYLATPWLPTTCFKDAQHKHSHLVDVVINT